MFFFLSLSPGIRAVYLKPILSQQLYIHPIFRFAACDRSSVGHLGDGSGWPCPLWGDLHKHTQVVAHSLVPPCRLL